MPPFNETEHEMILERAQRIHLRAELFPWRCLSGYDRMWWEAAAELLLCQEGVLPSHKHCRGDHGPGALGQRWEDDQS